MASPQAAGSGDEQSKVPLTVLVTSPLLLNKFQGVLDATTEGEEAHDTAAHKAMLLFLYDLARIWKHHWDGRPAARGRDRLATSLQEPGPVQKLIATRRRAKRGRGGDADDDILCNIGQLDSAATAASRVLERVLFGKGGERRPTLADIANLVSIGEVEIPATGTFAGGSAQNAVRGFRFFNPGADATLLQEGGLVASKSFDDSSGSEVDDDDAAWGSTGGGRRRRGAARRGRGGAGGAGDAAETGTDSTPARVTLPVAIVKDAIVPMLTRTEHARLGLTSRAMQLMSRLPTRRRVAVPTADSYLGHLLASTGCAEIPADYAGSLPPIARVAVVGPPRAGVSSFITQADLQSASPSTGAVIAPSGSIEFRLLPPYALDEAAADIRPLLVGLPLSKWTAMEAERRKSFDAVVFVYDTTHIDSLKQVAAVVAGDESKSELIDTAVLLVGNKSDIMAKHPVAEGDVNDLAAAMGALSFETSATEGAGVGPVIDAVLLSVARRHAATAASAPADSATGLSRLKSKKERCVVQ